MRERGAPQCGWACSVEAGAANCDTVSRWREGGGTGALCIPSTKTYQNQNPLYFIPLLYNVSRTRMYVAISYSYEYVIQLYILPYDCYYYQYEYTSN